MACLAAWRYHHHRARPMLTTSSRLRSSRRETKTPGVDLMAARTNHMQAPKRSVRPMSGKRTVLDWSSEPGNVMQGLVDARTSIRGCILCS